MYNFRDNIGQVDSEPFTAFEPIDVVYTWVNGSDPVWLKKKEEWVKRLEEKPVPVIPGNESFPTNGTVPLANQNVSWVNTTAEVKEEEDDTMSANRYRDSEELRYSLRSLVKNAPWIRHIYLVTDNQVPYWLNLETSKLSIITHEVLFANKSHLPVFSSPAIEANLHRIPGLSKKFIYFNDDVMLGTTVVPDDFVTLAGAQKFYMAWDVPKCAPGCSDSWIGDGFCDKACNVSACNFDFPDCINGSNVVSSSSAYSSSGFGSNSRPVVQCSKGCPDSWLGDKICDARCKTADCAFDVGDCGLNLVAAGFPGVSLTLDNAQQPGDNFGEGDGYYGHFEDFLDRNETATALNESLSSAADLARSGGGETLFSPSSEVVALQVPYGTRAVYFNLSFLPCQLLLGAGFNQTTCELFLREHPLLGTTGNNDFKYAQAEFDDNGRYVVHSATLLSRHHMLVVLLYHGQEDVAALTDFPALVDFTVTGGDAVGGSVTLLFRLAITERVEERQILSQLLPAGLGLIEPAPIASLVADRSLGPIAQPEANHTEVGSLILLPMPLRVDSPDSRQFLPSAEGVTIELNLTAFAASLLSSPFWDGQQAADRELAARLAVTLQNGSIFRTALPLCRLLPHLAPPLEADGKHVDGRLALAAPSALCTVGIVRDLLAGAAGEYEKFAASQLRELVDGFRQKAWAIAPAPSQSAPLSQQLQLLVFLPLPVPFQALPREWLHVKLEVLLAPRANHTVPAWRATGPSRPDTFQGRGEASRLFFASILLPWGRNDSAAPILPAAEVATNSSAAEASRNGLAATAMNGSLATLPANETASGTGRRLSAQQDASWFAALLQPFSTLWETVASLWPTAGGAKRKRSHRGRRKLLDTYAASLIHVNRLYNKEFGVEARKVPAHVPHMIDREVMEEMQARWPALWNETSSHRFRSPRDMQFSFSYYYYAVHRHKLAAVDPSAFLRLLVDHDHDGLLDPNEFRTLVALLRGGKVQEPDLQELADCVRNASLAAADLFHFEERRTHRTAGGLLEKSVSFRRFPSIEEVLNCSQIAAAIRENKEFPKRLHQAPQLGSDKEVVAFEMIGDNFTETLSQLDSIRQRQPKFICVNDNMKAPSPELETALRRFYESLFPFPSAFELPADQRNPFLHLDDYLRWRQQRAAFPHNLVDGLSALVATAWHSLLSVLLNGLQTAADALEEAAQPQAPTLGRREREAVLQQLRKDLSRNPIRSPPGEQSPGLLNRVHLFLSVLGLSLLLLLRAARRARPTTGQSRLPPTPVAPLRVEPDLVEEEDEEEGAADEEEGLPDPLLLVSKFSLRAADSQEVAGVENKLLAVNDIAADDYALALRMAAQDDMDSTERETAYFQEDEPGDSLVQTQKRRKKNKKKKGPKEN